jgi:hypothetical protein
MTDTLGHDYNIMQAKQLKNAALAWRKVSDVYI